MCQETFQLQAELVTYSKEPSGISPGTRREETPRKAPAGLAWGRHSRCRSWVCSGEWETEKHCQLENHHLALRLFFWQPVYHPLDMMCLGHETITNIAFHPNSPPLPLIASKLGPGLFNSEHASSSNSWMRFGSFNPTGHFVCSHTATVLPFFIVCVSLCGIEVPKHILCRYNINFTTILCLQYYEHPKTDVFGWGRSALIPERYVILLMTARNRKTMYLLRCVSE